MKILTTEQARLCDEMTISEQGITSIDLMERASNACAEWILQRWDSTNSIAVFCGNGNNGGDGFALVRLLRVAGMNAVAFYFDSDHRQSADNIYERELLKNEFPDSIRFISAADVYEIGSHFDIVVDCLFGSGLNRPLIGSHAEIIHHLNQIYAVKIAIDIPSGLMCDVLPNPETVIFKADHTLSFQLYKRTFLHEESAKYAGDIHIIDINLSKLAISQMSTKVNVADSAYIKSLLKPRNPFSHKGDFGTMLTIAGSYGMMGAAALCTISALRSGAGKAVAWIPSCGYNIMQTLAIEATCITSGENFLEGRIDLNGYNSIAIGPGMGQHPETVKSLVYVLKNAQQPLVIDADALNIISNNQHLLDLIPAGCILTPHPGELRRLFGESVNSFQMLDKAIEAAIKYGVIIVLKGRHSSICMPDGDIYYNTTGNEGMATGGSGDVLAGIIAGLVAQGYNSETASVLGVYIHGLAGDIAAKTIGSRSVIARDLTSYLGNAFESI